VPIRPTEELYKDIVIEDIEESKYEDSSVSASDHEFSEEDRGLRSYHGMDTPDHFSDRGKSKMQSKKHSKSDTLLSKFSN